MLTTAITPISESSSRRDRHADSAPTSGKTVDWSSNEEIALFREYLRIPSVQPNVDYEGCVQFLRRQANQLGLDMQVHHPFGVVDADAADGPLPPPKPVIVITWPGREPALKAVLLNSHMDVVPVFRESWTHDPFAADIDAASRIFARGSQDMKCVGTQYLAAVRELRAKNFQPLRTVHVVFVPDEEIGISGMSAFYRTPEFRALNIGFALDEGIASEDDAYTLFYAERPSWFLNINCPGTTGHGSLLHANTAGEKVAIILAEFLRFRNAQVERLAGDATLRIGDVTTINLTMLSGGVQVNVVPTTLRISFDIRLSATVQHADFERMLRQWCSAAGTDVTMEFDRKSPYVAPTILDATNPFWVAFKRATDALNLETVKRVCPGATDSRYLRELGIPAIGFSPMINTPVLPHCNDEFLSADVYLNGIEIYKRILQEVTEA